MKNKTTLNPTWKLNLSIISLSFLPRLILCFFMTPIGVLSDELATLSGGAYFAGLDWSAVVSHAGYYGTGFTAFTAPLYRLTDNPYVIYTAVGILCALLQTAVAFIACHLLKKYFDFKKPLYLALISVAASYLVTDCSIVIFNEHALVLCAWGIAWLLVKLTVCQGCKKQRLVYTCLLMLILGYSLTLHTRALSFWLSVGIAVLFYAWVYRRCLVSLPGAFLGGTIFFFLGKLYVHFIQGQLWLTGSGGEIRNGEIGLGGGITQLFDPQNWQAWANIVLGQIHTIGVFTGGLFLLFLVVFAHHIWRAVFQRKALAEETAKTMEQTAFPVMIFCMAGISMTILGQSLSWLGGSREAINLGFENNLYATKAYGYLRYFGPYCGPLFLICSVYVCRYREKILGYFKPALAALLVCEVYWMICIIPYICHSDQIGAATYYVPFSLWHVTEPMRLLTFVPASVVMFLSFFLWWWTLKRGKQWISFVLTNGIFLLIYFFIGIDWNLDFMEGNYAMYDAGSALIRELEDEVALPEEIYVEDDRWWATDHFSYYGYQFMLNRYRIIPYEAGMETPEETVLFTNMVWTEDEYLKWRELGYQYCVLDEDELLLVKGKELQKAFREAGVDLLGA